MPCLNFIKGTCCPHYDEEPERRPAVKKLLLSKKTKDVFAVDGGAALHIRDEKNFKSVVFRSKKSSFLVTQDGKEINEKSFKKIILI
jgi:aminopeptidase N